MAAESRGRGRTPPDTRIYAVGDVHGRKDLLDRLLRTIAADAKASAATRKLVVFLGDYVDRGPESRAVIETVSAGPPPGPDWAGFRWLPLMGNHEAMMLRFLDDLDLSAPWLSPSNGGLETLRSYIGELPQPSGLQALQTAFAKALPPAHRRFLAALPVCHEEGGYFFVHAGVRPTIPLQHQQRQDMLWIRGEFLGSNVDYGKIVVHGHTITTAPEEHGNRIGIDTGAFFTNRLTALVAEGDWRGFLST
jgi:serine/threonine protein phosphatase 1